MKTTITLVFTFCVLLRPHVLLQGQEPALDAPTAQTPASENAQQKQMWNGFEQLKFKVDSRDCLLVVPKQAAANRPWIWRTEFFGHEPQADLALLDKGFYVAYMDVQNMYGAPAALNHMDKFYDHLTQEVELSPKVTLEGFSRGGLFALNWAARHPLRVACLYLDAPVCDFKSWPAGWGTAAGSATDWEQCKRIYELDDQQARAYALNPIDNLAPLANAKIPILSVCGAADDVVPVAENSLLVEQRYKELGGDIRVILKPGVNHHPHSLKDPTPIVDFVVQHSKPIE